MKAYLVAALLLASVVLFVMPSPTASACAAEDPTVDFWVCVYVPYCTSGGVKTEGAILEQCVAYVLP